MKPLFKRCVFNDIRFRCKREQVTNIQTWVRECVRGWFPPKPDGLIKFPNFVLGYRWEASGEELALLEQNGMFDHEALKLHDNFHAISFRDITGEEFIPDVHPSQHELQRIEGRVREAAMTWTRFLENLR